MRIFDRKIPFILLIGDVVCFVAGLWLALLLRYLEIPSNEIFLNHLYPFSILFMTWLVSFFIFGLYEKRSLVFKGKMPSLITEAVITNSVIAITFFYFIPSFSITPKTTLFIYLALSLALVLFWRSKIYKWFFGNKGKDRAILVGSGEVLNRLMNEVNNGPQYNFQFIAAIDLEKTVEPVKDITSFVNDHHISVLVVDLDNIEVTKILPMLYNLIFANIRFIDLGKVYEEVFDAIPIEAIRESWFLENVSNAPKVLYDFFKRVMDILISILLGIFAIILFPIVFLAIKIEDGGSVLFMQKRIGKNGKIIDLIKFRSMKESFNDTSEDDRISRVGRYIRKTRIDELPQLWNVFKGDLSLIGPRPETPELALNYSNEIPYYNIRHIIKPGLSGWAQLYQKDPPKFKADFDQTKGKLAYDLYYIKNRSILIDLVIAIKTIKELIISRGV